MSWVRIDGGAPPPHLQSGDGPHANNLRIFSVADITPQALDAHDK